MRYTYYDTQYAPSSRRAKSLNENHNNENPIGKTFYVCLSVLYRKGYIGCFKESKVSKHDVTLCE